MGTVQSTDLNTDTNGVATTGEYADRGDGTSRWFHWFRTANGGNVALGSTTDTGSTVTDGTAATVVALLKGIGTRLASIITLLTVGASSLTKAEDAAHASGDAGIMALAVRRDTAAASSGTTGDYEPLQTDSTGYLRTTSRIGARVGALSNARTTALAETLLVKASAGTLFGLQGYAAAAGFIQVHADADGTLSGGAQALEVIPVGAGEPFSIDFGLYGLAVATGITIAFSSTGPTFTAGGSQMFVSAQYE